ncbi:MAG: hypothetical protein JNM41_10590 [Flavipsychrobacter sp.]|nr:hypothetical protein [Flavipsychrobacter sp.]
MIVYSSISRKEFANLIGQLPAKIPSFSGRTFYYDINLQGDYIHLKRGSNDAEVRIKLKELHEAYCRLERIDTAMIRPYITGRVYSPSCALLVAMKLYHPDGRRTTL